MNVALPLHDKLVHGKPDCYFVCGIPPDRKPTHSFSVGSRSLNFSKVPGEYMRSIVHVHGIWTPFEYLAVREARRRGALVVISPHGALESWAFRHKQTKKQLAWWVYQKRVLQSSDLLIVNSEQERKRLRKLGLQPPIATLPNGVNLDGFLDRTFFNREKVVLFFSRIDPKKGVPDLIRAWADLSNHNRHRLHIHGHGDSQYISGIKRQIAMTGRSDIRLFSPVFGAERWEVFTRASIYVLPSYSENFGITVAEALTAGLPVVTTFATPWNQLIDKGLGWTVHNDVAELRIALQEAISLDDKTLSSMRRKAHDYAMKAFNWDTIARQYALTYSWLSGKSPAPPTWIDEG